MRFEFEYGTGMCAYIVYMLYMYACMYFEFEYGNGVYVMYFEFEHENSVYVCMHACMY